MDHPAATNRLEAGRNARVSAPGSRILGIGLSALLMTVAANCVLKYLWWTACYSAWTGIPKLAAQWGAAGTRASLYGWSFLALEAASVMVVFSVIRLRSASRVAASLIITLAGTGLLVLALSVVKQGR